MRWVILLLWCVTVGAVLSGVKVSNDEGLFVSDQSRIELIAFTGRTQDPDLLLVYVDASKTSLDDIKDGLDELDLKWRDPIEQYQGPRSPLRKLSIEDLVANYGDLLFIPKSSEHRALLVELPKLSKEQSYDLMAKIESTLKGVNFGGLSWVNYQLNQQAKVIQTIVFPTVFVVCLLVLVAMSKSFLWSLGVWGISLLSTGSVFAVASLAFSELHILVLIAVLLCFVITLSMYCHFGVSASVHGIARAWDKKKKGLILAVLTTSIGILSLSVSELRAVREFALAAGGGVGLSFVCSIVLTWSLGPFWCVPAKFYRFQQLGFKGRLELLIVFIGVSLFGAYHFPGIPIQTMAAKYFSSTHPVREGMRNLMLAGHRPPLANIEISIPNPDRPELFYGIWGKLESDLEAIRESSHIGLATLVLNAQRVYTSERKLPSPAMALNAIVGSIPRDIRDRFVYQNYYRIQFFGQVNDFKNWKGTVESILAKYQLNYQWHGLNYQLRSSQYSLIRTLQWSFLQAFVVIMLLCFPFLGGPKRWGHFVWANLVPAFFTVGASIFLVDGLNVSTVLVFSLGLGLVVDGTIHLIMDNSESTHQSIALSQSALSIGLATLLISDFAPIRDFGLLMIVYIAIGVVVDIFLLAPILSKQRG